MKRKVIEIDEKKCNGCGACIPNCPEGALQVIDGKARLISDLFCDGLGACIGDCPLGAIHVVEREAEPYNEEKVMENIIRQGADTILAHLKHLKSHGEFKLLEQAISVLKSKNIPVPSMEKQGCSGNCPGAAAREMNLRSSGELSGGPSALRQWPIQLKLMNPAAEYFDNAELLISADCVAHASGMFHKDLLTGKILIIFCPKLDSDLDNYVEKLAAIFRTHPIKSITAARMEVHCCGGTTAVVKKAMELANADIPMKEQIIGIDGETK